MNTLGDMEVSERILSILTNVASASEGRKAISSVPDAFTILVDVLNWTDSPGCQEKASYILMVMAHKAYGDRQAMIEAGIVSLLLELTLLGSTLAQKGASRILECLRVDKGKQISENYGGNLTAAVSAPICGSLSFSTNPTKFAEQYEKNCQEDEFTTRFCSVRSLQDLDSKFNLQEFTILSSIIGIADSSKKDGTKQTCRTKLCSYEGFGLYVMQRYLILVSTLDFAPLFSRQLDKTILVILLLLFFSFSFTFIY